MSKRKAATKNDSTKPNDAVAQREPLSIERSGSLAVRAKREMDLWVSTLSYKDRGKLKMPRSPWGRCGGNIVAVGLRQGKTARRNRKLKRKREARFKAEQTAYEARRALPPRITDQNEDELSCETRSQTTADREFQERPDQIVEALPTMDELLAETAQQRKTR